MIAEGPIVTMAASFASSFGIFNVWIIFFLALFGTMLGDVFWYALGRFGRKSVIEKYVNKNFSETKTAKRLERLLEDNYFKAILLIKLVPPLPVPGLILTGVTRMKFKKFIFASGIISLIYCIVFVVLGYFFGRFIDTFRFGKLEIIIGISVALIVAFLFYKKYSSKVYKGIENIEKN
jgi:membrane protein DedA with SNARE-associated domain